MQARLEINLTMRCNIACPHCNRLIANMHVKDSDITLDQLHKMVDTLIRDKIRMRTMKVLGGEPLVHHDFLGAMDVLKRAIDAKICRAVAVVTNGILPRPKLPEGFEYWLSPVKDKNHIPVLASPTDLGIEDKMRDKCITKMRCGYSFDAWGFTFCPISGVLGRVLGIDTYRDSIPEAKLDMNICKHCPFGMPVGYKNQIKKQVKKKQIEYPTETWKAGLERESEDPMVFTKFNDDYSYVDQVGDVGVPKDLVQLGV